MKIRQLTFRSFVFSLLSLILLSACSPQAVAEWQKINAPSVSVETKDLGQLYQAALDENKPLIVWAGGDEPDQLIGMENSFREFFPGIDLQLTVDLSKYHAAAIDDALNTGKPLPDVVMLQTLHDFPYWKDQGVLLPYKPLGWDAVYPEFRDEDGYYNGLFGVSFATIINTNSLSEADAPTEGIDFLAPSLKDQIILTYPHDDDAVLFQFHKLIEKYGWNYIDALLTQHPRWVRGTALPFHAVASGDYQTTFTAAHPIVAFPGMTTQLVLPESDHFLSWVQTGAILADAENKAAAKLWASWLLSEGFQSNWILWSVRSDIPGPGNFGTIFDHPNTDPLEFRSFMMDRAAVERFRLQLEEYIGPVEGITPLEQVWEGR